MSEDIKEILDSTLKYLEGIDKTRNTKILTTNETNILLDYITNLQEEIQRLNYKLQQKERIIKEIREYIEKASYFQGNKILNEKDILEILDKVD